MEHLPRLRRQSSAFAGRAAWRQVAWKVAKSLHHAIVGTPSASLRSLPSVVIVGAQRSGTTSLYRLLQGHDAVVWPRFVKSPHWFDVNFDKSERWYRAHFPLQRELAKRGHRRITGEAAPYYLFHPSVPARLHDHLPDARVVAILRDPVDRAWSSYQHAVARGHEDLSFVEALDAEPERLRDAEEALRGGSSVHRGHSLQSYVARGKYASQLERYFDVYPRNQVLVLFTEELKQQPQKTFDRLCDFIGVDRQEIPVAARHHRRVYPDLDPSLRRRLESTFEPADRELEQLLGRPVPWGRR